MSSYMNICDVDGAGSRFLHNQLDKTSPSRRYGYDVLRVACALTVCVYHYECTMAKVIGGGSVSELALRAFRDVLGIGLDAGSIAVCLFFMLSGALACETTSNNEKFTVAGYAKHRALRLLPPLWLSWLLIAVWYAARGSFHFQVPAWRFIFTVLGLDGYVSYGLNLGGTFYYCGEWFYGAIVLVTLIWPLARFVLRKYGRVAMITPVLGAELLAAAIFGTDGTILWRSLPVCLASFLMGALISTLDFATNVRRKAGVLLVILLLGFVPSPLADKIRIQLLSAGVFGLIELREQFIARNVVQRGPAKKDRVHRIIVRLSSLTLYFFMYQFAVIRWLVPIASGAIDYTFGTFDYVGLALIVVMITLLAAALTQRLEQGIRAFLA